MSQIWDPNVLGPFDRCFRCFAREDDSRGFCLGCGRLYASCLPDEPVDGRTCFVHSGQAATRFCSLCARPICDECMAREGFSFTAFAPTPFCRVCIADSENLERAFLARIEGSGVCAKHVGRAAARRCLTCKLPHCDECLYYFDKGWFRQRLGDGPYCLGCFRAARIGRSRKWLSARDVSADGQLCIRRSNNPIETNAERRRGSSA